MSVLTSPRQALTAVSRELSSPRQALTAFGILSSPRQALTSLTGDPDFSSPRQALTRFWTAEFAGYFLNGDL